MWIPRRTLYGRIRNSSIPVTRSWSNWWQLTLDGALLDANEVAALAEAKRPLIRLRGQWVMLDPALLDRLRRRPRTRMRVSEALGAVLAGSAEIDGETVTVVAEGPLADLAAKVAHLASAPVQVSLSATAGW